MILGIDLGTTNSAASVWKDGQSILIPNALGHNLTPSVVSVAEDGTVIVGQAAKERLITHPQLTASRFKRTMGTEKSYQLGRNVFSSVELSSLVLKSLKRDAEAFLNEEIVEAVISVPAYFNDHQRNATKLAAELAGLKVERLINEPTAAALAYGLAEQPDDVRYMILDLGGGTFDVTVLEFFDGVMEVHASAGDNHLGGEDFVDLLVQDFYKQNDINELELLATDKSTIYRQFETAKRRLSTDNDVEVALTLTDAELTYRIDRSTFEKLSAPLLNKIQFPIERALMDANVRLNQLDQVILVGGATKMPLIRNLVAKLLKCFPAFKLDPDEVVAIGAGVQAGLKQDDEALSEIVLTDVCPYTLGIATYNEAAPNNALFSPMIERNFILPSSVEHPFYTVQDNQTAIELEIFQGESPYAKNNVKLGQMTVDVPKKKKAEAEVMVRFSYDMNGLLEVDCKVTETGKRYNKLFERQAGTLTEEQKQAILKKLATLKVHPREDAQNQALLARLERVYEQSRGDVREFVLHMLRNFETVLERQEPKAIQRQYKEIETELDKLENGGWLE